MSQIYDEYVANKTKEINNLFPSNKAQPMFPEKNEILYDKELYRELRDRAIISLVTKAIKEGNELSYGDIRMMVDNDPTEKEYETSKSESGLAR